MENGTLLIERRLCSPSSLLFSRIVSFMIMIIMSECQGSSGSSLFDFKLWKIYLSQAIEAFV